MSLSDVTTTQDSSPDSAPTIVSLGSPVAPLHPAPVFDPAASDPPHPTLHSKEQQIYTDTSNSLPQTPPDASLNHSALDLQPDGLPLILATDDKRMEVDDDGEGEDLVPEELALFLEGTRQRNRQPRPGAKRVMKTVRIRKDSSSSKRRTKKHALRVQLKEAARIEEEMAEYRGKKERPTTPERRPPVIEAGSSSRGRPSGLRFSESCYSDKEDEGCQDEWDEIIGTPEESSKASTQQNPHHQLDPEASSIMEWKAQTPPENFSP